MARSTRTAPGPTVRGVYQALNVAAIKTTLGAGVYGDVPQAAALPYLRIESDGRADNTMGRARVDGTVTVHVFSQTGRNADAIVDATVTLLDRQPITVDGYELDRLIFEQVIKGEDEIINGAKVLHRIVMFRILLWEGA